MPEGLQGNNLKPHHPTRMKHAVLTLATLALSLGAGLVNTQTTTPDNPDPYFIASPAELKARIPK
jgi:hypothetical protein